MLVTYAQSTRETVLYNFLMFTMNFLKYFSPKKRRGFRGEVAADAETLEKYSTDASAFRIVPQAVYFPKDVTDLQVLLKQCKENREKGGDASLTFRAGGTCMSGGPLNTSWIVDMTRHMNAVSIDSKAMTATVEMGAFFRDIEDAAGKHGLMFAAYPSSHRVCGIGGMIGNNASGEKSLRYGATSDNVLELDVLLADGRIKHISPKYVSAITDPDDNELLRLYRAYGEKLANATGDVKKSASGYRLEKVVVGDVFNSIPLFVGAQGTLGIVLKAKLRLLPIPKWTELLLISSQDLSHLPAIIETIYEHNPEGIETFDINTYTKALEHMQKDAESIRPFIDTNAHLFILAQFSEDSEEATRNQTLACLQKLETQGHFVRHITDQKIASHAWNIRRKSFLLMRDHNREEHRAVPCIEDVIVPLATLGTFVTELKKILEKHCIEYGFHGHIGDGSLRVIPIFDFKSKTVTEDIESLMEEVFLLIKRLHGNISADHSDGIIRTPYLEKFYGKELYGVFKEIKHLYDPDGILNPHKKIGGTVHLLNVCLDLEKPE